MGTRIGKAKLTANAAGMVKVIRVLPRQDASKRIGAEKAAERKARAWATAAGGGRASVYRRRPS
jgi:hypothetical protein